MARSQLRKIAPKHASAGGGRAVVFDGGQHMELHGYWIPDNRDLTIEVPIFQHAYYPKISDTDLDVKQNITYRMVTVPSLSKLRANGIQADRAMFVAEVVVHPRYIKHRNYFRSDFPASVKTAVSRDNMTFVFGANDMPSARFKRKDVLAFWRQSFTPLLIKGRQYTSGRMSMFFAAPTAATAGLKKSLNLEMDKTRDNLREWHPSLHQTRIPRQRGPKQKFTVAQKKIAASIVKETSERMADQLLPVMRSKLEWEPGSTQAKDLETLLSAPATSRSLLRATAGKKNRMFAVKRWVSGWLKPRLKEIAAEEGEAAFRSVTRFVIWVAITVILNEMLGEVQASKFGQKFGSFQRIKYKPDAYATHSRIGAGTLSYDFKGDEKVHSEQVAHVQTMVLHTIAASLIGHGTLNVAQAQVFDIKFDPNLPVNKKIKVTFDKQLFVKNKVRLGMMRDIEPEFIVDLMPDLNQRVNYAYEQDLRTGRGSSVYGGADDDFDLAALLREV